MTLDREEVEFILRHHRNFEWDIQGFGMLRMYVDTERRTRLQVWDQRLAVFGASPIHDHPWDFRSVVHAGVLYNQRFTRSHVRGEGTWQQYSERIITPGPNTIDEDDEHPTVKSIWLVPQPIEVYMLGESYQQTWRELHCTRYQQGTVTVIDRDRTRPDGDRASSIWKGEPDAWVSARPIPATEQQVDMIISDCLRAWWLGS